MSERQNLFRPIHKGIRAMIFANGKRLQATDFTDAEESNRLVVELKHDLGDSLSNCLLCLMSVHSKHEEKDIFAKLRGHDPGAVDLVMKEHVEISGRIREVSKTCDEVLGLVDSSERVRLGDRLGLECNELFSEYMVHLNHEEEWVVPVMWQWFTDEQLNEMRGTFYNSLPILLFENWMRWTLPALNPSELRIFVWGMANEPPPNRLADVLRIAKEYLHPERWKQLEMSFAQRAG